MKKKLAASQMKKGGESTQDTKVSISAKRKIVCNNDYELVNLICNCFLKVVEAACGIKFPDYKGTGVMLRSQRVSKHFFI